VTTSQWTAPVRLTDPDDALGYWLSRPVEERLRALEFLRRTFYGYTSAREGLQRVLEVAQLEPRWIPVDRRVRGWYLRSYQSHQRSKVSPRWERDDD